MTSLVILVYKIGTRLCTSSNNQNGRGRKMKKRVEITIFAKEIQPKFCFLIKEIAEDLEIRGFLQKIDNKRVMVKASGDNLNLDKFLDRIYNSSPVYEVENIITSPMVDYPEFRNVFRIIGL
jgi:acylphosphatase